MANEVDKVVICTGDARYWQNRLRLALAKLRELERLSGRHRDCDPDVWDRLLLVADTAQGELRRLLACPHEVRGEGGKW